MEFGKQLALGVANGIAHLLGKDLDQDALEKTMEKTVTNAMETLLSKHSRQSRKPSLVRVKTIRKESPSLPRTGKTAPRPLNQSTPEAQPLHNQEAKPKASPSSSGTALEPTLSELH